MAELWKPQPREVYQSWITAIRDEASDELNNWERDFIDSLEGRLAFERDLTENQEKALERIYTEKTK